MSRQINQPINQVRLTNVAIVRMQKSGKRFEIACYRNKVVNYRQGLEKDLSEVLQTERVFTNVSKGQFAKSKDLKQVFGTDKEEDVVKIILEKGTLQVSDLERSQQYENTLREVATWVANNCVHPISQRPYTVPQIRQAMKQAEFAAHPTKSVKRQYLDCVKLLQQKEILPIERAKMKLSLTYPVERETAVHERLKELQVAPVETSTVSDIEACVVVLVDPSLYRDLDSLEDCRLEIIQQVVRQEGDVDLEAEMERKKQQSAVAEEEQDALVEEMENKLHVTSVNDRNVQNATLSTNNNDDDDHYGMQADGTNSMRQNQKKANKKSKKAKRREKEQAAERQARIDAEKQRQEERAKALSEQPPTTNESTTAQQLSHGEAKSCNTCGGSFPSASAYRSHFRSDWHRYNVKLKMKGVSPVNEQEFLAVDSAAFFDDM